MARSPSTGAILEYADPTISPRVYTEFAFVTTVGTPVPDTPEIVGTALSDVAAVIFLGITDHGRTSMNFFVDLEDADQYFAMVALQNSKIVRQWKITWPISTVGNATASTDIWQGRVQSVSRTAEVQGMITGQLTIRATGLVTPTLEAA